MDRWLLPAAAWGFVCPYLLYQLPGSKDTGELKALIEVFDFLLLCDCVCVCVRAHVSGICDGVQKHGQSQHESGAIAAQLALFRGLLSLGRLGVEAVALQHAA